MRVHQIENFKKLFEQAELNASTEKEMAFISGFRLSLEHFGRKTYISEKQIDWVYDLAKRWGD